MDSLPADLGREVPTAPRACSSADSEAQALVVCGFGRPPTSLSWRG
jgi:hypothetical protein